MRIRRIDYLIDVCRAKTTADGVADEDVTEMLVQSLLINLCAEFERILKESVYERCAAVDDSGVYEYATSYLDATFASPSKKNISDAVKRFGEANDKNFRMSREEGSVAWTAYDKIIANRNNVAHGRPVQLTIDDFEENYDKGHVVLDWFKEALWIKDEVDS